MSTLPDSPPQTPRNLSVNSRYENSDTTSYHPPHFTHNSTEVHKCGKSNLKLQDFELHRTLGTGSFGRVHLVQSKYNTKFYAIKVLKKEEVVRLKQVEHTLNERKLLSGVDSPFIIHLWGTFQDSAHLYMVMDYVPGGELFSYLRKEKASIFHCFSNEVAKFYSAEVLLGLAYLHNQDIVYRDLKPENVLLDVDGHIKITDFGFAKHLVDDRTWTLCGTPDYIAPEIIRSHGYGRSVDYWSYGVLIYEMLAGYPPFYDENQMKLYEKILTKKPVFPSSFAPEATHLLQNLLTTNLTLRYGNLKKGYHDIMEHPWFAVVDFEKLAHRRIKPPYIPPMSGSGDSSNFDQYDENYTPYGVEGTDPYHGLFKNF
ncbi:kinase-like domain-containing protein [Spinellus fusiger]|nr:kinase-like domain-containing protein [Spinellus fusiger]